MRGLGIIDKITFGSKFAAVQEAGEMYDEWARRFAAQENAKTLSVLPDPGNTTGGEDEMVVDEGSVVGTGQMGTGKRVLRKVSIAKVATPVSCSDCCI